MLLTKFVISYGTKASTIYNLYALKRFLFIMEFLVLLLSNNPNRAMTNNPDELFF